MKKKKRERIIEGKEIFVVEKAPRNLSVRKVQGRGVAGEVVVTSWLKQKDRTSLLTHNCSKTRMLITHDLPANNLN